MTSNETLNSTCNNTSTDNQSCDQIDSAIIQQFKIIMIVVLIGLLIFLGFFVYNLIKCYLPKWRNQLNRNQTVNTMNDVKIEFESMQ